MKRPANTLFKQQRLPSWQPIFSPPHISACLVFVGIIFIPIGVSIFLANNDTQTLEVQYSSQKNCTFGSNDGISKFVDPDGVTTSMGCSTTILFNIEQTMRAPVYFYYKLVNFYQNHRQYVKSRSDRQLAGTSVPLSALGDTSPLSYPGEMSQSGGTRITVNSIVDTYSQYAYYPAGLIAWSKFNDTFVLSRVVNRSSTGYAKELICNSSAFSLINSQPLMSDNNCHKYGISWASDRLEKFKVPTITSNMWSAKRSLYYPNSNPNDTLIFPISSDFFFTNGWYANESGHGIPIVVDEDFIVWMRTAALPTFRKLHRIIDVDLPPGEYTMDIAEYFDVVSFGGEKSFVLATLSWVGGTNNFLMVAYFAIGVSSILSATILMILYKFHGTGGKKAIDELMNEIKSG